MRLRFIALTVLSVLTLSCTKNDFISPKESEIVVQAGVAQTRAGYEGTTVLPEQFVMDVVQNADPKYDYKGIVMEKTGAVYTPESSDVKMLWAGNAYTSVDVKAMTLPYGQTTVDSVNPMTVRVSQEQNIEANLLASDLLGATTAGGDISINNDKISIEFKHLLSKLEITYAFGNGLEKDDVIFNSVQLENIGVSGGFSYAHMSFVESVQKECGNIKMYVNDTDSKFEAIFFPYKPEENQNPRLVVDATILGESRVLSCQVTPKSTSGFEIGKRYTLKVTINNSSIATSDISIENGWDVDADVNPALGDNVFITE